MKVRILPPQPSHGKPANLRAEVAAAAARREAPAGGARRGAGAAPRRGAGGAPGGAPPRRRRWGRCWSGPATPSTRRAASTTPPPSCAASRRSAPAPAPLPVLGLADVDLFLPDASYVLGDADRDAGPALVSHGAARHRRPGRGCWRRRPGGGDPRGRPPARAGPLPGLPLRHVPLPRAARGGPQGAGLCHGCRGRSGGALSRRPVTLRSASATRAPAAPAAASTTAWTTRRGGARPELWRRTRRWPGVPRTRGGLPGRGRGARRGRAGAALPLGANLSAARLPRRAARGWGAWPTRSPPAAPTCGRPASTTSSPARPSSARATPGSPRRRRSSSRRPRRAHLYGLVVTDVPFLRAVLGRRGGPDRRPGGAAPPRPARPSGAPWRGCWRSRRSWSRARRGSSAPSGRRATASRCRAASTTRRSAARPRPTTTILTCVGADPRSGNDLDRLEAGGAGAARRLRR